MPRTLVIDRSSPGLLPLNRWLGRLATFLLAAVTGVLVTLNAFIETFSLARLGAAMCVLLALHLLRYPRVLVPREFLLYGCLIAYLALQLLWTADLALAMNTLLPAITFLLVMLQCGALVTFHELRTVLAGILLGLLTGMLLYTSISGFPFVYPAVFSYNAIAGMYLSGLFVTLLLSVHSRLKLPFVFLAAALMLLTLATTSIKTNLGIVLGGLTAAFVYSAHITRVLRRIAIPLLVLAGIAGFTAASNDALMQRLQRGTNRIALGVEILQSRDDVEGYSSLDSRARWVAEGLAGWRRNPLFGHGVEAFRAEYGMTSHSTPVDLLYNSGLIGASLFYAMLLSLAWRVLRANDAWSSGVRATVLGGLVCYSFMTLSGTMHYNAFLAVFVGTSTALLVRHRTTGNTADTPASVS